MRNKINQSAKTASWSERGQLFSKGGEIGETR